MRIAIAGYGVEGKASFEYWRQRGEVTIVDERTDIIGLPSDAPTMLGEGVFGQLDDFDLVIRTAGLAPSKIQTNGKVWSASNEFFAQCPAPIIGVTGTKGKGTTSSLIASILRQAGQTVHLVGNIGQPALEALPSITADDIVVYELSSFQLWDLEKSPHIAVVLMIEPDHLDVHTSFDEYLKAKSQIVAHQTSQDIVVYNYDNEWAREIAELSPAETAMAFPFDLGDLADSVVLPGRHNLDNAAAAVAVARQFTDDESVIASGLASFTGLPHRLQLVAEVKGVKYYDDSIATTPGSAVAAVRAFAEPKILLLGGHDKGSDYAELIAVCAQYNVQLVVYGENAPRLQQLAVANDVVCRLVVGSMQDVVATAASLARPGSVVILSPAAASFDMFSNYADRGQQFVAAVKQLAD